MGRRLANKFLDAFPDPTLDEASIFERLNRAHQEIPRFPAITPPDLASAAKQAETQLQQAEESGYMYFSRLSPSFPKRLRDIPDPPVHLFALGDPSALVAPKTCAVIGTREPTEFGRAFAAEAAETLVRDGWCIVSGLAVGCDTAGHEGALLGGGQTVAVLAHGLESIYPRENRSLARKIVQKRGCLVTEYPFGTRPVAVNFVERDRLQSALSNCLVVVETDEKGGTMHTVRFAREQGRAIMALEHPTSMLNEPKSRGNQCLLRAGHAVPCANASELPRMLNLLLVTRPERQAPVQTSRPLLSKNPDDGEWTGTLRAKDDRVVNQRPAKPKKPKRQNESSDRV